jgi:hypothetical protein
MHKNKIIILYLILLLFHIAHVLEEVWGRFRAIEFYGFGWFLMANWVLLCIPVVFFYYLLNEKRWAYILSIVYAGIMILNGLGHNIATIVTGRYFGGFAGGFSGIGFIIITPFLIYYLSKKIPCKPLKQL